MSGKKKILISLGAAAAVLICIYCGISVYFMSHFFQGTTVNNVDFSGKTEKEVQQYFEKQIEGYNLKVKTIEGETETIKGSDISMKYKDSEAIKKELGKQKAFLWPSMFWNKKDIHVNLGFDYEEEKLTEQIQSLKAFSNEGKTESINAKPEFAGDKFVVKSEVIGTQVEQEKVMTAVSEAVGELSGEMDLKAEECYKDPKYTEESEEVKKANDALNQYCNASITYDMPPNKEVVDRQLISTWVTCDGDMNVTFDEGKVREYMRGLAGKYDTLGATRPITTPGGKATEVSGGTYGWSIDEAAETAALIASIKAGEQVTREPIYVQRGATHEPQDWGKTFIEVDLSAQYMWYVVNGTVALETAVVTGNPNMNHTTPSGVYEILLMQRNATLVGNIMPETGEPEYRTPVDYWMQVTWGGVGFHDANWQPAFGGDLYLSIGSHGCINMPVDMAGALYGMIDWGTPVVMHY